MTTSEDLSNNEKRELYGSYMTNKTIRKKIDNIMRECQSIECNLGIDSTDKEREIAKNKQMKLLIQIKDLDPIKYEILSKII